MSRSDHDPLTLADPELVSQVLKGDLSCFRLLVDRHKTIVFQIIYRRVRDKDASEDLAQETFTKAYRALKSFQAASSFRTWLIRIALNHSSNYLRSRCYRQQNLNSTSCQEELSDNRCQQESALALSFFARVLATLERDLQHVVSLCCFQDMSYQQAAEVLAIPVGTVRSRLHRARLLLKDALSEYLSKEECQQ